MKYNKSLIVIIPFFFILIVFLFLGLYLEDNAYSEEEARTLAQRPELDIENLDAYFRSVDDYTVDQFPVRSHFLKAFTNLEILQGKKAVRDAYIADDEWIFTNTYKADFRNLFSSIELATEKYKDKDFYYFILPVKNYSLPDIDPLIVDTSSQFNLDAIYSQFGNHESIKIVDSATYFRNEFTEEELMRFWFKRDFHWNALGAGEAVYFLLDTMYDMGSINSKFEPSMVDTIYIDSRFKGDLNRRFSNYFKTDEPLMIISSKSNEGVEYYFSLDDSKPVNKSEIIGNGIGKSLIDYNELYTYNLGFYRVFNPNALDKSTVLILKDSLQNPTTDIFSTQFQEVIVVDSRYDPPYSFEELANISDIIIIMLHQNNPSQETAAYMK